MTTNLYPQMTRSHVEGESVFIDDRAKMENEVFVGLIYTDVAAATIKSIQPPSTAEHPSLLGVYTYKDIPYNCWGPIVADQPVLAEKSCQYYGEPIACFATSDRQSIQKIQNQFKINSIPLDPLISIEQAKEKKSFLGQKQQIKRGNPGKILKDPQYQTLNGTFTTGGQEHFYFEPQSVIAYPVEDTLTVHASSQHPTEVQHSIAKSLDIPQHKVTCTVKRMGGAFGGKESQASHFAIIAALVAKNLNRPARLVLSRDDDFITTGKRHPFQFEYRVAFDNKGLIHAIEVTIFANGGAYTDLSPSILDRALFHFDNAYFIPHIEIHGFICRTNTAPNTAFRGFGAPQAIAAIENIIEEIALWLKKDALTIRQLNCYQRKSNNQTPYGQVLHSHILPKILQVLKKSSDYRKRDREISRYNQHSPYKKKGISLIPVKFGISFTSRFLNQGSALINIHQDGTIQVSTGATEMGQGVNLKIIKIVAHHFGVDYQDVTVLPTSTQRNANTSPTAASSGADINCSAALLACDKIKKRLVLLAQAFFRNPKQFENPQFEFDLPKWRQPMQDSKKSTLAFNDKQITQKKTLQKISLKELIRLAYLHRVSLSDYAHYKTPGISYDRNQGRGNPFHYFTCGAACSEVETDLLTGQVTVLRSDILMDLGRPLDEQLDTGQIAGGFIQGLGWVTLESLAYSKTGQLLTASPSTYKLPSIGNLPTTFNISFIENKLHQLNIKRSKAAGEPPFPLAISIWTAIKKSLTGIPWHASQLQLPATPEHILSIVSQIPPNTY